MVGNVIFYLIVEITIIVLVGVIIGKEISIHENGGNPPSTTNTVYTIYSLTDYLTSNGTPVSTIGTLSPTYALTNYSGRGYVLIDGDGFTIQYGVDVNSNPFCYTTNQLVPIDYAGLVDITSSTSTNMSTTIVINGPGGGTLTVSENTNAIGDTININSNGQTNITDAYGDSVAWTPTAFTTNAVIILRSTNLVNWYSIYTNTVNPGYVQYFTDTQIFAPSVITFYNGDTNSGGTMAPPGYTNNASTNGILFVPGKAFYRVEYPSNQSDYVP
jgi:hypothetical protein